MSTVESQEASNGLTDQLEYTIGRAACLEVFPLDSLKKTFWVCRFHDINSPSALMQRGSASGRTVLTTTQGENRVVNGVARFPT